MNPTGFTCLQDTYVDEIRSQCRLYRHDRTGAEVLSVENQDTNKVFGISFRTPPNDSTGVAHILEHSVLCGSRKYPLKEPFVELLKGSLQTFLNAMTFPDKTCYPVASQNTQDFYNLIDVYLDAVFHPRLTENIFRQEGWHYELESPEDTLRLKGVVYNEMKGAYSSPDGLLSEYSQQTLFPDTTYGLDSGGNPSQIPELTFEQFLDFHRTYYHPSNARIFFYGDDDPEERLRLIDAALQEFSAQQVDSSVGDQAYWQAPKREERVYAAGPDSDNKTMLTVNWLLGAVDDVKANLTLQVLEDILLGAPGAPLRQALLDSGYGEDIAGVGLEEDLKQMFFSTGLKGISPDKAEDVERLLLQTLQRLVDEGLDPEAVQAGLNTVEFELRENNTGSLPRGLLVMIRSLSTWLHDKDPLALLQFEAPLQSLRDELASGRPVFEECIRRYLLDNPHRSTLILQPDTELTQRMEAEEAERLAAARQRLGREGLEQAAALARQLQQEQEEPDPPEALARLPRLTRDDLDPHIERVPASFQVQHGVTCLGHGLDCNGIVYVDLGFDIRGVAKEDLGLVPLLGRALVETGTAAEDYVRLMQRIRQHTGGIHPQTVTLTQLDSDTPRAQLFIRGKVVASKLDQFWALCTDILCRPLLEEKERVRQIVLEEKAHLEQALIPGGHQLVNSRLRASFTQADTCAEQMGGVEHLFFLRRLVERIESDWEAVAADLRRMYDQVIRKSGLVVNITSDEENIDAARPGAWQLVQALPEGEAQAAAAWPVSTWEGSEALTLPAQVNYVGKAVHLAQHGMAITGPDVVACRYLRTSWLWDKIRVQGGAYGAFSLLDRYSGVLAMLSYRDPNVGATLKVFDGAGDFVRGLALDADEIDKAVVGAIGDMDKYQLPDAKGFRALLRFLAGESDDQRQEWRDAILGTTADTFRGFAEKLDLLAAQGRIAVLGGSERLQGESEVGFARHTKLL